MLRIRGDRPPDPRLLIVEIGEADIRAQNRVSPSDEVLAQVLSRLNRHNPRVIGLDLHRDVPQPPGTNQLAQQLQASNVVTITELGDSSATYIPPPPNIPPERVGFNDIVIDADGVVRRNLLLAEYESAIVYSFALRVALSYIAAEKVESPETPDNPNYFQIGSTVVPPLTAQSGGYQNADVAGYQTLLDYRSAQQVARRISLSDVLANEFNPNWVTDNIVLVGNTAPSSKDLFYTPYSAGQQMKHQMPGVIVHAQMVSQLLDVVLSDRPLFWFWADWAEIFWLWAWAAIGAGLAWLIRHPVLLGAAITAAIVSLGISSYGLLLQHGWVPLAAPAIAVLMSGGMMVAYRAQQSQRQQQMVMTLLGQNTSPEIAAALWHERDRLLQSGMLPGQRLVATMLFTDIKDFSRLAEKLSPEDLLNWLNEYLEAMTQAVQAHQGIVNKFTGDGLLAVFGVPIPRLHDAEIAQDATHAVDCALMMSDRLNALNESWQARGLDQVQMRIGIFTGPVVVGSLGGKERLEYGVIGDSVNVAARLEGCEKHRQDSPCRILIARETQRYLSESIDVDAWGAMTFKGKDQAVEVYRVLGWRSHSSQLQPKPHHTPLNLSLVASLNHDEEKLQP
jgi:CHASE2 domain-containing sensor protein